MIKIAKKLLSTIDKKSFMSYAIIGFTTAGLYFSGFVFFFRLCNLQYVIAISLAYLISLGFNFTANRCITFSKHKKQWHLQFAKYLCVAFFNYLVSLITVHIVVENFHLSPYFGTIMAIGITVMSGYLFSKNWIYCKNKSLFL